MRNGTPSASYFATSKQRMVPSALNSPLGW